MWDFCVEPILVLARPLPVNPLAWNAQRIRRTIEVDESDNRFAGVQYWVDEKLSQKRPFLG